MTLSTLDVHRFVETIADEIASEPDPIARNLLYSILQQATDRYVREGRGRNATELMLKHRSVEKVAALLSVSPSTCHRALDEYASRVGGLRPRRYPPMR